MTRSRSAAVAVALCLVAAACSSGDDDGSEAQGSTTSVAAVTTTVAPPTTTVAPATTTTTAAPTTVRNAGPSTPEEQAAVDAIDRWLELEDQAFSAGTTDAVIDELDALMADGSVAVQGSLDLGGPVERTSRARIDRIWHPADGVTGLDVCKTIETPQGEARTAHTITATDGATPFLQNETVSILERDGVTCPPDDIIEPVLATYERWMELEIAAGRDPGSEIGELLSLSGEALGKRLLDFRAEQLAEGFYVLPHPEMFVSIVEHDPEFNEVVTYGCRTLSDEGGAFNTATDEHMTRGLPGDTAQFSARLAWLDGQWQVVSFWYPEDIAWCEERL